VGRLFLKVLRDECEVSMLSLLFHEVGGKCCHDRGLNDAQMIAWLEIRITSGPRVYRVVCHRKQIEWVEML
jgi:hypothetical protein